MKWPYSVFIELTNKCNSHCLHCRENSGKNLQDELSTEEIKTILTGCPKSHFNEKMTLFSI
ncbi:hypothetical protein, partial [Candidatus Methanoperedens sp. BLZ2]|uniref:hypothetical protein n=1 Tax=Candidatus Methanoperedens sp. BLZ2 TaxID=2035255 RepID=UPI001C3E8D74